MCASKQFNWYPAHPRIALRTIASFGMENRKLPQRLFRLSKSAGLRKYE